MACCLSPYLLICLEKLFKWFGRIGWAVPWGYAFRVLEVVSTFLFNVGSLQKCFWGIVLPEEPCLGAAAEGTGLQGEAS